MPSIPRAIGADQVPQLLASLDDRSVERRALRPITHWTATGKQLNGIRLVQLHPNTAARTGIQNGDAIRVESPRGSITATALSVDGIRDDSIFVPNLFGPNQIVGEEIGLPLYEPANTLIDDRYFDNLSGQQAYKCFACRVVKA
jgi:anaerobic selenocysteine-containing dehydrogenase